MRFVFLVLMPWFFLCCSTLEEPPPATSAAEDVAIVEGAHVAKAVVGGVVVPVAKPSPTASAGLWMVALNDAAAGDSLRMQAADHLLQIDCETLALSYRSKGNILLIRALIEDKIKEKDESVLPLLLLLFKQVDSEERIDFEHYILAFGRRAEADLYPLLHANNRSVALRAMDTLAKMRSSPAADTIAHFLRHESPWMRMSAAHALGEIGAQGAVGHLVETLNDSAYAVVNAALVGLGRLKAVEAYEPIEGLLVAANKHVRKHAAMALGELGDRRALEKVRAIAANDGDAGVRFMATKAVEKLEKVR
jgi:HEAT repeat protein